MTPWAAPAAARPARVALRVLDRRRAGVLLHPTSLPDASFGALGQAARSFIDWLVVGGFSVWQVLPLGPVGADRSPYFARSNHAGDPGLIDLEQLVAAGLVEHDRLAVRPRAEILAIAAARLNTPSEHTDSGFAAFREWAADWLPDYALYTAIQSQEGGRPWWDWPLPLRERQPQALAMARATLAQAIAEVEALQYFFHAQWQALRGYAAASGVRLFGDLPIYLAPDSVETWRHPTLFELGQNGRPTAVAGVPPDYFAAEGQLWGNPLYRWEAHERSGFAWWVERLRAQADLFDVVRIDHFRGLESYWAVPAAAPTAVSGEWRRAPGDALLARLQDSLEGFEVVAEDLGIITPDVERLREAFGLPGMRVAQFGFDEDPGNVHALHAWVARAVGYSGTHDNDTTLGWYAGLDASARQRVRDYVGAGDAQIGAAIVRAVLASVAGLAMLPMQDLLGLGREGRMNTPGTTEGNWQWAFRWSEVAPELAARCRRWNELYGRT